MKSHVGRGRNGRGSNERTIGEGEEDGLQNEFAVGGLPKFGMKLDFVYLLFGGLGEGSGGCLLLFLSAICVNVLLLLLLFLSAICVNMLLLLEVVNIGGG